MRLLYLLAEALSAEKEAALKQKFVQVKDKENPMAGMDPNKISEKEFKALLDIDETPNGTYLSWIIPRYVKMDRTERQRFFNDGHNEQVKELFVFFDKNKQRIKKLNIEDFQADINLYKTLRDFENVLGTAKATIEGGSEDTVQAGPEKYKAVNIAPIKILGTTPSGFVVYKIPQSCNGDKNCYNRYLDLTGCGDQTQNFSPSREKEEAPKGGYAVKWCTRGSMFDSYLKNGPYYLFKNWNTRRQAPASCTSLGKASASPSSTCPRLPFMPTSRLTNDEFPQERRHHISKTDGSNRCRNSAGISSPRH